MYPQYWTVSIGGISLSKKPYCSEVIGLRVGKGREKPKKHPLVDGEFLEIHRSKLELDPGGYRGQPSIGCITHGVFLFCVRKDALNGLGSQGVGCLAQGRMSDVLRPFYVLMPDVALNDFGALSALGAAFTDRAVFANVNSVPVSGADST